MKFEDLILMNEATIIYLKKLGISPERNNIIKEMLKDRAVFKKLPVKDAFIILRDIGIAESKLEEVYKNIN